MSKSNIITTIEQPEDLPDLLPKHYVVPKYPVDALGSILGQAAKRLAYHVQVPEGMAAQSVLAVAALVAQGHINVQRGTIGLSPVSLFFLSVAESGDRKSTVDRLALAPIREYESIRCQEMEGNIKQYHVAMEAWTMRRNSIIKFYNNTKPGEMSQEKQNELARRLLELETIKPQRPTRPNITFSEPTSEGIWKHYVEGEPNAGLFSDEGISFFAGHGMTDESKGRSVHMLSKLWDGDPISRTRGAEGESGVLIGRRLSTHLMVQPVIANKVLADPLLQGQGFLARFLICYQPSIAGTRFLAGRNLSEGVHHDPAIVQYCKKITELLNQPVTINKKTGEPQRRVSKLQGEALDAWCALHDGIEDHIRIDGNYHDVKAFASKAAENAARIAAILAYVEEYEHPSVDHIQRAGTLIAYYLELMVMGTQEALHDKEALLGRDLFEWIKNHDGKLTAREFNRLPNNLRSAKKVRQVLEFLVDSGNLQVYESNSRNGKPCAWRIK